MHQVRAGVGDDENREKAARVAAFLVSRGADVGAICRWTHMSPLHLAAFFDSDQVMKVLLQVSVIYLQYFYSCHGRVIFFVHGIINGALS